MKRFMSLLILVCLSAWGFMLHATSAPANSFQPAVGNPTITNSGGGIYSPADPTAQPSKKEIIVNDGGPPESLVFKQIQNGSVTNIIDPIGLAASTRPQICAAQHERRHVVASPFSTLAPVSAQADQVTMSVILAMT